MKKKQKLTACVVTTYPIKHPRHGGQIRCSKLLKEYEQFFQNVIPVAVPNPLVYNESRLGPHDVLCSKETSEKINLNPSLEAWYLGESPFEDPLVKVHFIKLFEKLKPDVIILEQPYLYLGISKLCTEMGISPSFINSTQNIETSMMETILQSVPTWKVNKKEFEFRLSELSQLERELSQTAVGSIAVSEFDAQHLANLGSKNTLIASNGVEASSKRPSRSIRIERLLSEDHTQAYGLFVGSAHRPNVTGFIETLGSRLGFIPENAELFIAGGVGQELRNYLLEFDSKYGEFFWNRARDWGQVHQKTLESLISNAHCILLPITSGGGSNLKTAEAILSGRPIIATEHSFRGFEKFSQLPHVTVTNSPQRFKSAVSKYLSSPFVSTDRTNDEIRSQVTWEHSLSGVQPWLKKTFGG